MARADYGGKKMKVKCVVDDRVDIIKGRIYEVEAVDETRGWYAITDESGDSYWYGKHQFEVVEASGKED